MTKRSDSVETRAREPVTSLVLYRLLKWSVVSPMFHVYFRGKVYGTEKVPRSGPLLVVSNHASYFDPPFLSICMNRPVAFMAKEELFRVPLLKQGIALYGAYPVNRQAADRSALRASVEALKKGWLVGIFLSGTRTPDGRITEPKLGAAMIAAKSQLPLLPVSLWGTDKILVKGSALPHPAPVTVRIGDLIAPPSSHKRSELEKVTQQCTQVINSLHDLGR